MATLLSSADTREKALAALGDQERPFRMLAREFGLRPTFSFVENAPLDGGTSYFAVDPSTFIVPSVCEVSLSINRTPVPGPEEVSVSLMCLFKPESPAAEVERIENALRGLNPETGTHPPAVSISFDAPRVDVIARIEAVLEALHQPCGLHPNMKLPTTTEAFLKLPELNRRAIELFQRKALHAGNEYLHNGPPENRRPVESIIRSSIQALGVITLFEAQVQQDLESLADLSAGPVRCLLDSIFHHQDDLGLSRPVDHMANLLEEFIANKDLRGMCGLAAVLTLQRQDAITRERDIFRDELEDETFAQNKEELPEEYDRLLHTCFDTIPSLARTPDDQALITTIINALCAEGEIFERNLLDIGEGIEGARESFEIPLWAQNSFLLGGAIRFAPKPPRIEQVFNEVIEHFGQHGEDKGASLLLYGVMNPTLQESILEVIDTEGLFSSPALLMEKVYLRVKELLPPEVTATMTQTVNYLADELAIMLDVKGYQLGSGVYRER